MDIGKRERASLPSYACSWLLDLKKAEPPQARALTCQTRACLWKRLQMCMEMRVVSLMVSLLSLIYVHPIEEGIPSFREVSQLWASNYFYPVANIWLKQIYLCSARAPLSQVHIGLLVLACACFTSPLCLYLALVLSELVLLVSLYQALHFCVLVDWFPVGPNHLFIRGDLSPLIF